MDDKKQSTGEVGDGKSADKELWDLLGRSREVKVSPMFSRNVMREIRQSSRERGGWQGWMEIFRRPVFQWGVAAAAVFVGGILVFQNESPTIEQLGSVKAEESRYNDPAHEFESIERLGELMAVSDPGTLSDEALFNLLF